MRVVDSADIAWAGTPGHRDGDIEMKTLLEGQYGQPNNYWLVLFKVDGAYDAPRHAHNFEQVRIMLEGAFDFGDQDQEQGSVGYFCEGTPYTQTARGRSITLLLQCEGASRARYLGVGELRRAVREMTDAGGRFENGLYDGPNGRGGRMKRDGALAVYEFVTGERPTIPPQKFDRPVIMRPDRFRYFPHPTFSGVEEKKLGAFGERALAISYLRISQAAAYAHDSKAAGDALFYVLHGGGRFGGAAVHAGGAVAVEGGDAATFQATAPTTLIRLTLPG